MNTDYKKEIQDLISLIVKEKYVSILRGEKGKEKTIQIEGRPDHELEEIMDAIP